MFKKGVVFFIRAISPLHPGAGQELGIVDLPVQRERHTGLPKIEASGVKGSIKEAFREMGEKQEKINVAFGPDEGNEHASTLGFSEARLLLFPIKSAKGIFALATSPLVLRRFLRELSLPGIEGSKPPNEVPRENTVPRASSIVLQSQGEKYVILEEFSFKVREDEITNQWAAWLKEKAGIEEAPERLVILPDDEFSTLVNLSTEVITRIKINHKTGTVEEGALFTEEFLPSETVFYSLALATPLTFADAKKAFPNGDLADEVLKFFKRIPKFIQMGGDATIGKGIVEIKLGG